MKKLLLLAFALGSIVAAGAALPRERSTAASAGSIKQITRRAPAAVRPAAPVSRAGEVPANAVEVPFTHGLGKDSKGPVASYTAINANGDNRQWQYGKVNGYGACMAPSAADVDANDDWLITVPIHMPAGKYTLSFTLGFMGSGATSVSMETRLGTAPTVEGMIAEITPVTAYTKKDMTEYSHNLSIPEEGYYYIGFHCVTPKSDKGALKLTDISVKAGQTETVDPPAAGTLTWELAPKGELKATVTYTAPTKTVSGAELKEISKVVLTSRWTVDKFEYTDVTPGQTIVQEVEMYDGFNNHFSGVAYVGDTPGEKVEYKSIYCGKDTPLAPSGVTLVTNDDYKTVTLSWTAPGEVGENGGYVDTESLVYYIFDAFGSYYDPAVASTDRTSITLSYPELVGQDLVAYQVTAAYGELYSLDTASNIEIVGTPSALPFTESFTDGFYDGLWALDPKTGSQGQRYGTMDDSYFSSIIDPDDPEAPAPLTSHDGDNGFYYWLPMEKDVMWGLLSLRADISKAANPVLEFWYQGQGSTLDVLLAAGTDSELKLIKSIDLKNNPTAGWTLARIPLSDYKARGAVRFELRLTATHNTDDATWSVPIDDISIRDLVSTDMRLVSAKFPEKAKTGDIITIPVRIENLGTAAAQAAVELYIDGKKADSKDIAAMPQYGFADTELSYTVPMNADDRLELSVAAVASGDAVEANNGAKGTVTVKFPSFPAAENLAGTADNGTVTLTWSAPSLDTAGKSEIVTDDFESDEYTPMSISGAGGWTVYDGDGERTINVFYEEYNPFQTAPMAFQLFNREAALVPAEHRADAEPHSGNSFMLAPTAYHALNDNWLISPELSGNAQTISFWAKSFSIAWPETFELYYSTTDNAPASFTNKVSVENYNDDGVPEDWTEFKAALPEGARYFAIHHNPEYTCALFIDDVTYEAPSSLPADLTIEGYHVFRNGEQLTDAPVAATTFTDTNAPAQASHLYQVVTVYNHGTARPAAVTVNVASGIESVVSGSDGPVRLYRIDGIEVDPATAQPGVYITVKDGKASKTVIR